jgi:hypothetical protein
MYVGWLANKAFFGVAATAGSVQSNKDWGEGLPVSAAALA